MTRDYAKKPGGAKSKAAIPPWIWMLTGLLIGLFVAFLVYINQYQQMQGASAPAAATRPAVKPKPAPVKAEVPRPEGKVRFDFYSILPELEVVIPEDDLRRPETPLPAAPGNYLVQAGSFRTAKDADTRRAQLALLGLVSRIQTVTVDGKDTWHRVQLGPYPRVAELEKVRKQLQDNGIDFLILKQKS